MPRFHRMLPALARKRTRAAAMFAAVAAVAAVAALGAGSSFAAQASTVCGGHVEKSADPTLDNGVTYKFGCSDPIKSYTIVSTTPITGFDTEVDVLDSTGAVVPTESASCEGTIPSDGINCQGSVSAGHVPTATVALDSVYCGRSGNASRPRIWVVVADANNNTEGPFLLAPYGCPRPKPKKHRHHH